MRPHSRAMSIRGGSLGPRPTRRRRFAAALVVAAVMHASMARAAVVDYLYVESNEGGSSGGHVALRIGDRTYDFQHHSGGGASGGGLLATRGLLRIERRDAEDFLYSYAYLQNRPVHVTRLGLDEQATSRLSAHFNALYLAEQAQFEALDVLGEDRRLMSALAGAATGSAASIALPAVGYFFARETHQAGTKDDVGFPAPRECHGVTVETESDARRLSDRGKSAPLLHLRERVRRTLGDNWIPDRICAEQEALQQLPPKALSASDLEMSAMAYPRLEGAFSERYRGHRSALAALQVLDCAPAVLPDVVVSPRDAVLELDAGQVRVLRTFSAQLEDDLVALLSSQRRDWGTAMLVGMARLDVIERSIQEGTLRSLDAFPSKVAVVSIADLKQSGALPDLIADAREDLVQSLALLSSADSQLATLVHRRGHQSAEGTDSTFHEDAALGEAKWNDVESAINRYDELVQSRDQGRDLRVAPGRLVPERGATVAIFPRPEAERAQFAETASRTGLVERQYSNALHKRLAYDLVTRNCVSELLSTIEDAFVDDGSALTPLNLKTRGPAGAVPFLSSASFAKSRAARGVHRVPSWREQRLAELRAAPSAGLGTELRESNAVTSKIYRRAPDDSWFFAFADRPPLRPLAGTINLAGATGAAVLAIATVPFRGVAPLESAVRGILFSLPELAFLNIRKGTFQHVGRKHTRLPDWW